jgi:hypothetical protein
VLVEVAEVVGGHRAELVEQPPRQVHLLGQLVAVLLEQARQDVLPVKPHGAHPREVVEADLVDHDAAGLDAEQRREPALERDRDVAEPDRAVARVEQRPGDDPDRVGEVDDPHVGARQLADSVGDLEHDRDRPHGLREAAGPRRLLADAAAGKRCRLVAQSRGLAADPDLDEHEARAFDGRFELAAERELAPEPRTVEHPAGEPPDDLQPTGVDVVQGKLSDLQAGQAGDELRRVGRPGPDDSELHPFTPVRVTPSTKARCARKKRMITGAITTSVAAIVRFHCTWCRFRYCDSPTETGQFDEFSPV